MGVKGLWEILRPASEQRSIVHLSVQDGFLTDKHDRRGYRIGIDAYIWFFHSHSSREGENPELRMLFFRLARFLALPILPVFVFDGPAKPRFKRGKPVRRGQHSLTGGFKGMIEAFGFEWHQASGEAEAELAYLNRIEVIDAVLSDDVDNFLFGATLVMRNPSANLSGNRGHAMRNADGKQDDKHVMLFSAEAMREHPDIGLTHGGFILIGLLSGGDYDMGGLSGFGIKISHGLARGGLGDSLVDLYMRNRHDPHALHHALSQWRTQLRHYLSTDPDRFIGKKQKALANSIPDTFPPIAILEDYIMPQTSELHGHIPTFEWAKQPDIQDIANKCEMHYEWGVKPLIIKRFRTVIWGGALMRVLRASVMEGDEKEKRRARNMALMQTPRKGRRALDMAVGTPSKLVSRCLSRMELHTPQFLGRADDDDEDLKPLCVKIHSQRTHASTDGLLEYRLEIAPAQFVEIVELGLRGLRREDSIDVANFGRRRALLDEDLDFGGDEDEEGGRGKKSKAPPNPTDHMRIWVPACMLEMAEPKLVEEYEGNIATKEQKRLDKERRAREKAEGIVSPKKSRAKKASPTKSKASQVAADVFGPTDDVLMATPSKPRHPPRRFVNGDSSDEGDVGPTPRPKGKAYANPDFLSFMTPTDGNGDDNGAISETDYLSSESITDQRRTKGKGNATQLPRLDLPPVPAIDFSKKKSTLLSALESPTKVSTSRSNKPPAAARSKAPTMKPSQSSSSASNARQFLFTLPPDVQDLDADEDDGEMDLNPYSALMEDNSGSSRASSGSQPVFTAPTQPIRPTQNGKGKGKTKSKPSPGDEPMEDFSHLFSPLVSSPYQDMDISEPALQLSQSSMGGTSGRRHKFVSDDDEDEPNDRHRVPVRKSPKKSKGHISPRKTIDLDSSPESVRRGKSATNVSSSTQSTTQSRRPTQSTKQSNQPTQSSQSMARSSSSLGTTSMPSSLKDLLDVPPSQATKKKNEEKNRRPAGKVDVVDLDSSSDEGNVFVSKPAKTVSSSGAVRRQQQQGGQTRPKPRVRADISIIDLD